MPEYPDVGCVARLDIFSAGADNDKNVENETGLRVEAQRVSGCGCGEPAKRYGCIGVRRLCGSRGGRASVLCAVVVHYEARPL